MSEGTILQLLSTTGAAAALFWVLYKFLSGDLHSNSEMKVRDEIIEKQDRLILSLTDQLKQINDIFEKAVEKGYISGGRSSK